MGASGRYPILAGESRTEESIQRSRFITSLCPVESVDEARAFLERIGAEFPDATHHCYAFLVGPPGSSASVGMSDDGEPHGTAGGPMLNVLVHCGLGDVAAVVTRYFGGTKLGKGGLVRAYAGGLKQALETAERTERIEWERLRLTFDYSVLKTLRRLYGQFEAELLGEVFEERVVHRVRIPHEQRGSFESAVSDATAGRALVAPDPPPP